MRIDRASSIPRAVIRPVPGQWHPHVSAYFDKEGRADAVYQLAALTVGARLAVADA